MNDHSYNGYVITLIPSIEDMWECQYVIKKSEHTKIVASLAGQTYRSREQAESAALEKAKAVVDGFSLSEYPSASGY